MDTIIFFFFVGYLTQLIEQQNIAKLNDTVNSVQLKIEQDLSGSYETSTKIRDKSYEYLSIFMKFHGH